MAKCPPMHGRAGNGACLLPWPPAMADIIGQHDVLQTYWEHSPVPESCTTGKPGEHGLQRVDGRCAR